MLTQKSRMSSLRHVMHGLFVMLAFVLRFTPGLTPTFFAQPAELLLAAALLIALYEHDAAGAVAGGCAGILMDICTDTLPGFHTALFMIMCAMAGYIAKKYLTNTLLSALLLTAAGTLVYKLVYWLVFVVAGASGRPFYHLMRYLVVSWIFTVILTIPCYLIIRFYRRRFRLSQ